MQMFTRKKILLKKKKQTLCSIITQVFYDYLVSLSLSPSLSVSHYNNFFIFCFLARLNCFITFVVVVWLEVFIYFECSICCQFYLNNSYIYRTCTSVSLCLRLCSLCRSCAAKPREATSRYELNAANCPQLLSRQQQRRRQRRWLLLSAAATPAQQRKQFDNGQWRRHKKALISFLFSFGFDFGFYVLRALCDKRKCSQKQTHTHTQTT